MKYCNPYLSKPLTLLLLFLSVTRSASAQVADTLILPPATDTSKINPVRVGLVAGASSGALVGVYVYLQNVWWSNQHNKFTIDHDQDYKYAKNMDKVAHFIGGNVTAELFGEAFQWAGMGKSQSYLYGGLIGVTIQGIIEIKDGFAPTYGYSFGDLAAGSAGSFLPLLQYHVPAANAFRIKLSYYRHHDYYFRQYGPANSLDDYMNQTYWLSCSVNDLLPKGSRAERIWPDFLTITGGWGVDETLNYYNSGFNTYQNKGKGKYEYYLSLDIDWRKIIKQNTLFKRSLTYALNYVKLPLPTVRLGPSVQYHWAFW